MDPLSFHTVEDLQRIRPLTSQESDRLSSSNAPVFTPYKANKLEAEAKKSWDLFYKRNKTNFFKDRHWTLTEFPELVEIPRKMAEEGEDGGQCVILEAGCGVGNFILPVLSDCPHVRAFCCDFSDTAIRLLTQTHFFEANPHRVSAFQCDLTLEQCFADKVLVESVDIATLIFVLSAIHPDKFTQALSNIFSVLKPGGLLIFRDYALRDYAQIRFDPKSSRIDENFYARQDNTRAFYFSTERLRSLAEECGYECRQCVYVTRTTENKKEGLSVPRIFVQARFVKPL